MTKKLKKLALGATQGPWAFGTFHRLLVVPVRDGHPQKHEAIADFGIGEIPWDKTENSKQEYNNAAYVAAASPDVVLALIEKIESFKATLPAEAKPLSDEECGKVEALTAEVERLTTLQELTDANFRDVKKKRDVLTAELDKLKAASDFDHSEYKRLRDELKFEIAKKDSEIEKYNMLVESLNLVKEDSQEANDAIWAMLEEYNFPANPQNAGRAGWKAARHYFANQFLKVRSETIEQVLALPQIAGNLFAERAIKELL